MKNFFVFFLLLIFVLVPCFSETEAGVLTPSQSPDNYNIGKQYFDQGEYEKAYDYLFQAFLQDPQNLDINFYMGRAAFESKKYEEAIMAYERILIMNPDATRVKLELARTHMNLGAREVAKQYFREVLATNPPEAVWKNIQYFLETIEAAEKRHYFNGLITAGVAWDDNINVAPVENTIFWFGYPLSTSQHGDLVYNSTLVLNHVYRLEDSKYSWKTTLTNFNGLHEEYIDQDVNFYQLTTGPVLQVNNYLWEVQGLVNQIDYEHDRYLDSFGLGSRFSWFYSPQLLWIFGVTAQQKNYFQDGSKDANNLLLTIEPVATPDHSRIGTLIGYEREDASDDGNSYNRFIFSFRYDQEFLENYSFFTGFRFQKSEYDDDDPNFFIPRSDKVYDINVGLSRILWRSPNRRQSLAGQVSYTYTSSNSSVELYTYEKNIGATSLTYVF